MTLLAVDTSVIVAAFATWHDAHEPATDALARGPRVPAHALIESFSVLTRMPPPHRASADAVAGFLGRRFVEASLALSPLEYAPLVERVVKVGIRGGAIYDALIAATVAQAGAVLLTRDRRALPTYERMGVRCELVG